MTMSDLQKKRKNHQSQGSGPLKKVKLDAQIKTGATPRDTGFKKKKKKMKQKSYQKKDSSDSKNKFETKNTSVTVGSVTKVNTLSQLVSEGSDAKKKQKKLKKNKKVISTKVQKSNSAGEVSGVEKKKLKKKKWEKRKKNKLKGDKTVKVNENKKKEKKNAKKNKVELNIPKGPSDFDSNWKELLKTLEKPEPKKDKKPFILRKKKKLETSGKTTTTDSDIWFDDVDEVLLGRPAMQSSSGVEDGNTKNPLVKPESFDGLTKILAMDCEMVGVGEDGKDSILARASIVNQFGQCVYDKYVKPLETVTDYRTHVSGILPEHLKKGEEFSRVCKEISDLIKGRLLVGHAIHNDLKVLFLDHPHKKIRDTQRYKPFRALFQGRNPSLKKLTEKVLGVKVQEGQHDSIQDAQAAMRLYTMHRQAWEKLLREKTKKPKTIPSAVSMDVSR